MLKRVIKAPRCKLKPVETRDESAYFQSLELRYDRQLSTFVFKFNVRHYVTAEDGKEVIGWQNIELISDRPFEVMLEEFKRLKVGPGGHCLSRQGFRLTLETRIQRCVG